MMNDEYDDDDDDDDDDDHDHADVNDTKKSAERAGLVRNASACNTFLTGGGYAEQPSLMLLWSARLEGKQHVDGMPCYC